MPKDQEANPQPALMEDRGRPQATTSCFLSHALASTRSPELSLSGREKDSEQKQWNGWFYWWILNWPTLNSDLTNVTWLPQNDSTVSWSQRERGWVPKQKLYTSFMIWKANTHYSNDFSHIIYKHLRKMRQVFCCPPTCHWVPKGVAELADHSRSESAAWLSQSGCPPWMHTGITWTAFQCTDG